MAQVTSPIILDSTGQQIHSDLQQIKNVLTTPSAAADITFDNTGTGMQADDVQDAITELKSNLTQLMLTDNEIVSASEISDYSNLSDITISSDGLYSFSTAFDSGGGSNLILILANKLSVEIFRNSIISAPRYTQIQTPVLWLKAGTYKLRATGDLSKKITYTYRE